MSKTVKLLTISALFTAMITSLTFFPRVPVGNGYIHFGDSMIFLAACILPTPYALFAAAIGGGLADWFGFPAFILPTMIIKALISLPFSNKSSRILTKRNALALIPAGIVTAAGYYAANIILFSREAALVELPANLIQIVGGSVMFVMLGAGLDRIGFKKRTGGLI